MSDVALALEETEFSWRSGSGPASLSDSEIHVWKICLEQPSERVRTFQGILSPAERQRCEVIHFQRDKASFCICRGSLRTLLGRYAGTAPEQVRLRRGPYGKLSLDPRFHTKDIHFNVSHSGTVALISLAVGRRLGVDVQMLGAAARIDDISRGFFSTQEDESIRALREEMKTAAFYSCWTRKEAAIKALGGSIAKLSDKIIVSTFPRGPAQILQMPSSGEKNESGESSEWHLRDLPVAKGYAAAVCYGGPPAEVFLWQTED